MTTEQPERLGPQGERPGGEATRPTEGPSQEAAQEEPSDWYFCRPHGYMARIPCQKCAAQDQDTGKGEAPKSAEAVREDVVQRLMDAVAPFLHSAFRSSKSSPGIASAIRTALQGSARDAARYQWLRDEAPSKHAATPLVVECDINGDPLPNGGYCLRARRLDDAIDAAMQGSARADQGEAR